MAYKFNAQSLNLYRIICYYHFTKNSNYKLNCKLSGIYMPIDVLITQN